MGKYSWCCQKAGGNHKSVWTKLPAALKRITAVHHGALDDKDEEASQEELTVSGRIPEKAPRNALKKEKDVAQTHVRLSFLRLWSQQKVQLVERKRSSRSSLPWSWTDIWPWTSSSEATCAKVPSVQSQPWQIKLDFLVSTGFSWKTTFNMQRSQIWSVWENSQMAVRWKFGGEKIILEACKCCLVWCASKDKITWK